MALTLPSCALCPPVHSGLGGRGESGDKRAGLFCP